MTLVISDGGSPYRRVGKRFVRQLHHVAGTRMMPRFDSSEAAVKWSAYRRSTSQRRRAWKMLHFTTDADTGQIVTLILTLKNADNGLLYGSLLDEVEGSVALLISDGAYDRDDVYAEVAARDPDAPIIVSPRSNAVPSGTVKTAPAQRDAHLHCTAERGRMG